MEAERELQAILTRNLAKEVGKNIDIKKIAKRLAPKIEKEMEARILAAVKNFQYEDCLFDSMDKDFYKSLTAIMVRGLRKLK